MKKRFRLKKKLSVKILSLIMATGLLLLIVPFIALASGKEEPEPGKKGDFSLFKGFYATMQVAFENENDEPVLITAAADEVETYQWQAYSINEEKYVNISGKRKSINLTVALARQYDYGNGKSYFRCQAVNAEGVLLTSDVLTVVFPAAAEASEPSETGETSGTVETIELSEPTLPGETEDTTASTEPTGEVTEATAATTEATTEATGESTQSADTTTEPTGETTDPTLPDQDGQSDDGETDEELPPIRGMLLAPLRGTNDINIMFDLDGGLGVSNTLNATTGDSLIVGTPSKSGYIFTGWTVIDPTDLSADEKTALETDADNGNLTVPEHSVTFKANWEELPPAPSTSYTIVYWLQNAAAGDNGYSVYSSRTVSNVNPGSSVTLSSNDLLFPTQSMRSYVSTYKSNSDVTKPISADGSTVFNVYFDRKTYTITFNVNKPSATLGSVSDPVFSSAHSLTFTAKYGQNISDLWVDDSWLTTHPVIRYLWVLPSTQYIEGVTVNGTLYRNKPMYLTSDIISNGNTSSYNFDIEWVGDDSTYTVVYRFQTVQQAIANNTTVGNFQTRSDVPNQTVYSSSTSSNNYSAIAVDGFTYDSQNTDSSKRTIYRNYKRNSYKLHYANTSVDDATLYYEQSFTKPSDPTKIGYTFAGWYSDAALTDAITDSEWSGMTMPAHDAYVYAKWTKNPDPTHTVTVYLYQGASNPLTTITTTSGNPAMPDNAVQNRSRAGYRFLGWYYDNAGTETEFIFNSTVVNSDLTVYGKWELCTAKVTFFKDSTLSQQHAQETVNIGSTVPTGTVSDPTKEGYTFTGWFYMDGSNERQFTFGTGGTTVNAAMDVYAKWTVNSHKLIFANTDLADENVDYGTVLSTKKPATDPSRTGYTFGGWYSDSSFTTAMDWTQTMPDADKTVYAKWTLNSHTLKYRNTDIPDVTVNYGTSLNSYHPAADPVKTGYTFAGWYSDSACTNPMDWTQTMPDSNVNVYAKWTVNSHKLIFANTDLADVDVDYGTVLSEKKPATDPTKRGHIFRGWYADAGFNTTMDWTQTMPDANKTVYAKWEREQYLVRFYYWKVDGGSSPFYTSRTVRFEDTISDVSNPSPYGDHINHVFKYWWYLDENNVKQTFVLGETQVTGNLDLYGEWNPKYNVTFKPKNGDSSTTVLVENGTTMDAPPITPTKEGYTFDGWYYMDEGEEKEFEFGDEGTVISGDTEVYAKWLKNEVTLTITNGGGDNVFTVSKSGFTLKIAIPAGQTVTVTHLPFGDYTVTNGKWDYRNVSGISSQSVNASTPGEPISVSFGGSDQGFNWLGGEVRKDNRFGAVVGN